MTTRTMVRQELPLDRSITSGVPRRIMQSRSLVFVGVVLGLLCGAPTASLAGPLRAGVAKVDITNEGAGPVNDRLYVKALVLQDDQHTAVLITLDAVAIAHIGSIKNDFLAKVRADLERDLQIRPEHVLVNASHCHGIVCDDVQQRTVKAVTLAAKELVPVRVGAGVGREDRIMENRRLKLKSGKEADVRHAYSLPPDEEVESVGPVDPQIGILRIDRMNGTPLAAVFNFACHPIQGVPSGGNTADLSGFACRVIEENLGDGAIAFFVQGCGGDINPALYKDVDGVRDAEEHGSKLALSTLKGLKPIQTRDVPQLKLLRETMELPRANLAPFIDKLIAEQKHLLQSLKGTSLNLKTFLPLVVKYNLDDEFPSYYSHRYLHEQNLGRDDLQKHDARNRRHMNDYIQNIHVMEQLTRVQTNLDLLKLHHAQNVAAGKPTIDVEVLGWRIGDFVLVTFPGELTVQIGLNIKQQAPHPLTFVAGYTNGYIYYCPTAEQLANRGNAQEDSDCLLAPEWQAMFETKAAELLRKLQ